MSKRKTKQRYVAIGVTGAIILTTFLVMLLLPESPAAGDLPDVTDTGREVTMQRFDPADVTTSIPITGRIRAVDRIDVYSEVQGILLRGSRPFRTGNRFTKGDVLVQLDGTDMAFDLFAQRSRFQASVATLLPALKTDYAGSYEKWASFVENIDAENDLKELPEVTDRQERFFLAGNDVFGQYYSIRAQENRLGKYTLRAPFSGELRQADAFPGTLIQQNTKLGEFVGDVFELEAFVSLQELEFIAPGDAVSMKRSGSEQEIQGKVTRIGSSVDASTQSFPVYIELKSSALRDGLYFEGSISGRTLEQVVEIPRNLLTRQNTVLVIEDSLATHRDVDPLFFNRSTVLVRGLHPEDQVIELRAGTTTLAGSKVSARQD